MVTNMDTRLTAELAPADSGGMVYRQVTPKAGQFAGATSDEAKTLSPSEGLPSRPKVGSARLGLFNNIGVLNCDGSIYGGSSPLSLSGYEAGDSSPVKSSVREPRSSPILSEDGSEMSHSSTLAVATMKAREEVRICLHGRQPTSVQEAREVLSSAGFKHFHYISKWKHVLQPNGDTRIDLTVDDICARIVLKSLKKTLGGVKAPLCASWFQTWKQRVGMASKVSVNRITKLREGAGSIVTWNVNGIRGKDDHVLRNVIDSRQVVAAFIQETLVEAATPIPNDASYRIFRKSAQARGIGMRGQAIFIHRELSGARELKTKCPSLLSVFIPSFKGCPWVLVSVYMPSGGNCRTERSNARRELKALLKSYAIRFPDAAVVVGGDFNTEGEKMLEMVKKWRLGVDLKSFTGSAKTRQPAQQGKRWSSIDFFLVNTKASTCTLTARVNRSVTVSDHFPVTMRVVGPSNGGKPAPIALKLARNGFSNKVMDIVTSNRFDVLANCTGEMPVDECGEGFANAVINVADDYGLVQRKAGPSTVNPRKRQVPAAVARAVVKRDNAKAAWINSGRNSESIEHKAYNDARVRARSLVRYNKGRLHAKNIRVGAELNREGAAADFWKWLERFTSLRGNRTAEIPTLRDAAGNLHSDAQTVANLAGKHYADLAKRNDHMVDSASHWRDLAMGLKDSVKEENTDTYCPGEAEVIAILKDLPNRKAVGPDGIPNEWLKLALVQAPEGKELTFRNKVLDALVFLVQQCWASRVMPTCNDVAEIVSLFKKGDPHDMANYRGISLINCVQKVINSTINVHLEKLLSERNFFVAEQGGFRPQEEVCGNLVSLMEIIKRRSIKNAGPIYLFFADFQKAFDTVHQEALFAKLSAAGVDKGTVDLIRNAYGKAMSRARFGSTKSPDFPIEQGTRQGDTPSPLLFLVFINDIFNEIKAMNGGVTVPGLTEKIVGFMFADDVLALAEDIEGLRKQCECITSWCSTWGMRLNVAKCGVMVLEGDNLAQESLRDAQLKIGNELIPIVTEYKYLGITITKGFGSIVEEDIKVFRDRYVQDRKKGVTAVAHRLRHYFTDRSVPIGLKITAYKAYILPVATFGGELMGMDSEVSKKVQSACDAAVRWIMGTSSKNRILAGGVGRRELGIPSVGAMTTRARARARVKWEHSTCIVGKLITNPLVARKRTWVSGTPTYVKRCLGLEWPNNVNDQEAVHAFLIRVEEKTSDDDKREGTNAKYKAMPFYEASEFEVTASLISKDSVWIPRLNRGLMWLARFRCRAIWTSTNVHLLGNLKGDDSSENEIQKLSHRSDARCSSCGHKLGGVGEWAHLLLHCGKYKSERGTYIHPFLRTIKSHIKAEKTDLTATELAHEVGIVLLGGGSHRYPFLDWLRSYVKPVESEGAEVRECSGNTIAMFLTEIMPRHMAMVFKECSDSDRQYTTDSGFERL
jgi:exonuclease III